VAIEGVQSLDVGFSPRGPEADCFGIVLVGEALGCLFHGRDVAADLLRLAPSVGLVDEVIGLPSGAACQPRRVRLPTRGVRPLRANFDLSQNLGKFVLQ
jgi:hypothetical protein